jgi:hypothetical protein
MDKLITVIEENIQKTVQDYMLLISSKYNIDINELENLWTTRQINVQVQTNISPKTSPNISPKTSSPSSPKKPSNDKSVNKCIYKFTKGKQQGEVCNGGIKGESQYCSKHIKFEESGQKDKKPALPVSSATEKKSVDRLVRLNKDINKWWHVESKLVFKSDKEKIVIGVYKDDTYRDLCNDDIEECNKYGFRYEIPQPKKLIKVEKTVKPVKSVAQEINMSAKNIEDVISDMLEDTHIDDSSDNEELEDDEEELEEED